MPEHSASGLPICPICRYPVCDLYAGICFICRMTLRGGREPEVNTQDINEVVIPTMTVAELDAAIKATIQEIEADADPTEERSAIQNEDDRTTERALLALQRSERFKGEHEVARAWLAKVDPGAGIFGVQPHE